MASLASKAKTRIAAQRLSGKLSTRYATQSGVVAGTVAGRNLANVGGRMVRADGLEDYAAGTPVTLTNVGTPGLALYAPEGGALAVQYVAGTGGGSGGGGGVTDHGALSGLADDDHLQYLTAGRGDLRYILATRVIASGAGLTGGGDLSADRTLAVGVANTGAEGLTVEADAVRLTSRSDVASSPLASILASDSGGGLGLKTLTVGTVDETAASNLTFSGHAVISAARSAWLFIDSDNNSTSADFIIGRGGANATDATPLFTFTEPGRLEIGSALTLSGINSVDAEPDIQFYSHGMIAAESGLYLNIDSNNDSTGAALIVQRDAANSGGTELMRLNESGILTVLDRVRVPLLDTAAGVDMTIEPSGDLYLMPDGLDVVVDYDAALRSDNFLKTILTAGFRIGPTSVAGQTGINAGSAEFDELRARIFVADETRVDRGQWFLTKSYGILSRTFTAPSSVGGTANLYVENSPHIAGALFSNNDWVLLRYLDMSSGITLTSVWGQVSGYTTTGLTGEQRWTFTLRQGTGSLEFAKGAIAVDFGGPTSGYFILGDAVSAVAPYFQVAKWTTNPYSPANYTVLTQMGRLDGVGFTGEYGLAAGVAGFGLDDAWIAVSTAGAQLNKVPLRMYTGSGAGRVQTVNIDAAGTNVWFGNGPADKRLAWDGATLDIVGRVTAISGYIGTAASGWEIDNSQISNTYMRLYSGGPGATTSRLEVGAWNNGSTGQVGVIGLRGGDGAPSTIGSWAGRNYANRAAAPYRLTLGGDLYAASADVTGNVNANTGTIAAWDIGIVDANTISSSNVKIISGNTSVARIELGAGELVAGVRGGDGTAAAIAFWAGAAHVNRASAPFRAYLDGTLVLGVGGTTGETRADNTGIFVNAQSSFQIGWGYKFKLGGSLGAGLTSVYAAADRASLLLWNNTTSDSGVSPLYSNVNSEISLRNVAGGTKTSTINLAAWHNSNSVNAAQFALTNDGTNRIVRAYGTAIYFNNGADREMYHAGNIGTALTNYATNTALNNAVAGLASTGAGGATFAGQVVFNSQAVITNVLRFTALAAEPAWSLLANGQFMIYAVQGSEDAVELKVKGKNEVGSQYSATILLAPDT